MRDYISSHDSTQELLFNSKSKSEYLIWNLSYVRYLDYYSELDPSFSI